MKKATSIEEYLIDYINQKYAKRVMQQLNTEFERRTLQYGSDPSAKEYEWMVDRALEIHRNLNKSPVEDADEKETANPV